MLLYELAEEYGKMCYEIVLNQKKLLLKFFKSFILCETLFFIIKRKVSSISLSYEASYNLLLLC